MHTRYNLISQSIFCMFQAFKDHRQKVNRQLRHYVCPLFMCTFIYLKKRYTRSVKLSDFTVWRHTWRKNWVNCAVLTGNSAGLRTVLSSRLSNRELRSSFRESHTFLTLPADTTMASSQGTSVSSNSFSRWASHDTYIPFQIPLLTPLFTLSFLLFG